jgi:phenylpropionate dioxygenase-like ring-hydroxylating dioxygenase large terminal subunit
MELQVRVPIADKVRPEHYQEELQKVFGRAWLCVAHTADVPEPGSFSVVEVPTFNTSLLITRTATGKVHAFHNVCTHRGNKLVRSGSGSKRQFTCGFHGWTFSGEGKLTGVPDESQFKDFNRDVLVLPEVRSEVWQGHLFVNFDKEPRYSLREWLGELYGQFDGYFEGREELSHYEVEVDANWHLAVNSFTEGYHTRVLHRNTAPDYLGSRDNLHRHRPFMQLLERHSRYSAPANPEHRATPAEVVAYANARKLVPAYGTPREDLPPGVNPGRVANWAFDVMEFFPNFVAINANDWHLGLWFWPIDAGRTLIRGQRFMYKAATPSDRLGQVYSKVRAREVLREDLNTMEAIQQVLKSGALTHIQLSQQELSLQHHFRVLDEMMAQD